MAWVWILVGSVKPPAVRLSVRTEGRPREIKSFKEQFFLRPKGTLQGAQDDAARKSPADVGQADQQVQSGDKRDIARVLA